MVLVVALARSVVMVKGIEIAPSGTDKAGTVYYDTPIDAALPKGEQA